MPDIVGPGAAINQPTDVRPLLEGASEYEFVTILNPLTDDFQVQVAQDVPVNLPMEIRGKTGLVQTDRDVVMAYGLDLKNPNHQAKKYIHNTTIIPAGQTMNFRGNEAQVVVRQLVNEILQREGKKRMIADPTTRQEVEQRIIQRRGSVQELMDGGLRTPTQQINEAVNQSNEVKDEFPGLKQPIEETTPGNPSPGTESEPQPKRSPGRPAKAQAA